MNHTSEDAYEAFKLGPIKQMRCYFLDNCKKITNIRDERTDTLYHNSVAMSKHKRFN